MRSRLIAVGLGAALLVGLGPALAYAQDDPTEPTTAGGLPEGVGIGDFVYITGATVTPPDGGAPRTMDDYDAAVFVQSWLATAFFGGQGIVAEPPAATPVYRIDSEGSWNGEPGTVTSYLAIDGTTPYVAFPGLVVWQDPAQIPPAEQWFIAPDRVVDAFNGDAELLPTTGTDTATSIPGSADPDEDEEAAPAASDDDDSSFPVVPLVAGAAVLALVGGALWSRRRRGGDDGDTEERPEPVDSTTG